MKGLLAAEPLDPECVCLLAIRPCVYSGRHPVPPLPHNPPNKQQQLQEKKKKTSPPSLHRSCKQQTCICTRVCMVTSDAAEADAGSHKQKHTKAVACAVKSRHGGSSFQREGLCMQSFWLDVHSFHPRKSHLEAPPEQILTSQFSQRDI